MTLFACSARGGYISHNKEVCARLTELWLTLFRVWFKARYRSLLLREKQTRPEAVNKEVLESVQVLDCLRQLTDVSEDSRVEKTRDLLQEVSSRDDSEALLVRLDLSVLSMAYAQLSQCFVTRVSCGG